MSGSEAPNVDQCTGASSSELELEESEDADDSELDERSSSCSGASGFSVDAALSPSLQSGLVGSVTWPDLVRL